MKNEINLTLQAHPSYSYVPRTSENAKSADVTVAFATDFSTAGERLTKREAGSRYLGITYGMEAVKAAELLSNFMKLKSASTLNVAGNGIYTLAEKGITQAECNQWVYDVLYAVSKEVTLTQVRSGGQTGVDQAGLVAAIALSIPALGLYPAGFRRRNAEGVEIQSHESKLRQLLTREATELSKHVTYRFHQDGSLPQNGEVFVFGSNLAGRHGKGSALVAKNQFGAIYGVGKGRQGQSYAIPSKDGRPNTPSLTDAASTLPIDTIRELVNEFIDYANEHKDEQFFVVRIGCQLAAHTDAEMAPLFKAAPSNCSFPDVWEPWLSQKPVKAIKLADPINIWSGSKGLGGALTNMTERAKEKGCIKFSYPVKINHVMFPDSEAAYQALKVAGEHAYNDGLMIDILALKFQQHSKLFDKVTEYGGAEWLALCSHKTNAKSASFQSWEGEGVESRFIRNLIAGYLKAKNKVGPTTRVVHVKDAPYDVYIGRQMEGGAYPESEWHNPVTIEEAGSRERAVQLYYERITQSPELMARVKTLQGRTVGCWCKSRKDIHKLCHGDVLVALAEGREWTMPQEEQGSLF